MGRPGPYDPAGGTLASREAREPAAHTAERFSVGTRKVWWPQLLVRMKSRGEDRKGGGGAGEGISAPGLDGKSADSWWPQTVT